MHHELRKRGTKLVNAVAPGTAQRDARMLNQVPLLCGRSQALENFLAHLRIVLRDDQY
jgi:hypothetical protein